MSRSNRFCTSLALCFLLLASSSCLHHHLPPLTKPGTSIVERSAAFANDNSGAIIIPESAFKKALSKSDHHRVNQLRKMNAISADSAANDPRNLGVFGKLHVAWKVQKFSGDLFIVTRDGSRSPDNRVVQGTDYYIASVDLSGTSPWLGTRVQFGLNSPTTVSTGRCCGSPTICVPNEGPGPIPCDPFNGLCLSPDLGISHVIPPILNLRIQNGLPPINLIVYPSGGPGLVLQHPGNSLSNSLAVEGGPGPILFNGCTRVVDPTCAAAQPYCFPGDNGYTTDPSGQPDPGSGSVNCGGSSPPPTENNVPKICTMVEFAGNLPSECGNICPDCGLGFGGIDPSGHLIPPGCQAAMPADPNSDICTPPNPSQDAVNNAQMQLETGWMPGKAAQSCQTGRYGNQLCTSCDASGNCTQTYKPSLIDPTIASIDGVGPAQDQSMTKCEISAAGECSGDCGGVPQCPPPGSGGSGGGTPDPPKDNPQPSPPTSPPPPDPKNVPPGNPPPPNKDPDSGSNPGDTPPGGPTPAPSQPGGKGFDWGQLDFADLFTGSHSSGADPVLLGDGSFNLRSVDLSFDGPVRPFEFIRAYNSQSLGRGSLGSNWHHNWDVRIQPLNVDTIPAWALPYCAGSETVTTCLLLRGDDGGVKLFFFDMGSGLYMPQASSTDTITKTTDGGWALRTAQGQILYFNSLGLLVNDRDRFGNGFKIDYENASLYNLYSYYCNATVLAQRNETKYSRRCAVLAYLLEESFQPISVDDSWKVTDSDYPLAPVTDPRYEALSYARAYFLFVVGLGPGVHTIAGGAKMRPTRVTDDLGRTFVFRYTRARDLNFGATPQSELLAEVHGPAGTTLRFSYARPVAYPPELNEMFLTQVNRKDSPDDSLIKPAPNRQIQYRYDWPSEVFMNVTALNSSSSRQHVQRFAG